MGFDGILMGFEWDLASGCVKIAIQSGHWNSGCFPIEIGGFP